MPQNSHGIMMSPSAWPAWGWDEGTLLWLLEPPACRPLYSHGFGEELLLLNEAKALAGLHPVCYTNNMEKSPFLMSQVGTENHFPWQRPRVLPVSPTPFHTLSVTATEKSSLQTPRDKEISNLVKDQIFSRTQLLTELAGQHDHLLVCRRGKDCIL